MRVNRGLVPQARGTELALAQRPTMTLIRKYCFLTVAVALAWAQPGWCADEIHWTLVDPATVTFDWRGAETAIRYGLTSSYGQTATAGPRFVLAVGDLTYGNANGLAVVDNHFNDMMVWSQDAAYMPVWGNHEWDVPAADDMRNYKGRFGLPNPQTSPGSPSVSCCGEDWSWFDYGNVRFIAFPEPWTSATWTDWQTHAAALMDQAQADPAIQFIVTYGHRPAYSSGHHPGDPAIQAILDGLGDTHSKYVMNLNGHSHDYERSFPQRGVVHLTVGTGGAALEQDGSCLWLACTQPSWSAFRAMRHGPLVLRFTNGRIQGQFLCGPAGGGIDDINCTPGAIVDSFTITAPGGAGQLVTDSSLVFAEPNVSKPAYLLPMT